MAVSAHSLLAVEGGILAVYFETCWEAVKLRRIACFGAQQASKRPLVVRLEALSLRGSRPSVKAEDLKTRTGTRRQIQRAVVRQHRWNASSLRNRFCPPNMWR